MPVGTKHAPATAMLPGGMSGMSGARPAEGDRLRGNARGRGGHRRMRRRAVAEDAFQRSSGRIEKRVLPARTGLLRGGVVDRAGTPVTAARPSCACIPVGA